MTQLSVDRAFEVAEELFQGLCYGKSQRPMMDHLVGVVEVLREFGYHSDEQVIVGVQHDTLEDTAWELSDLSEAFGRKIAYAVYLCSDGPGTTRKARKAGFYARWEFARSLCQSSRFAEERDLWHEVMTLARRAKMADRLFNVRSCVAGGNESLLQMYRSEHHMLAEALTPDPQDPLWVAVNTLIGT